jgi:hypothetical protein
MQHGSLLGLDANLLKGDSFAVVLGLLFATIGLAVAKYFADAKIRAYIYRVGDRGPYPEWTDPLNQTPQPLNPTYEVTILNEGRKSVSFQSLALAVTPDPQPLAAESLQQLSQRPLGVDLSQAYREQGTLTLPIQLTRLNHLESASFSIETRELIGTCSLRIDADDVPPEVSPEYRPPLLVAKGNGVVGAMELILGLFWVAVIYYAALTIWNVLPRPWHVSWWLPLVLLADVTLIMTMLFCFAFAAIGMYKAACRLTGRQPRVPIPTPLEDSFNRAIAEHRSKGGTE